MKWKSCWTALGFEFGFLEASSGYFDGCNVFISVSFHFISVSESMHRNLLVE